VVSISVVICTRDRNADLGKLLGTILGQKATPYEVIVVDTSREGSAQAIVATFGAMIRKFESACLYVKGGYEGLTAARRVGVKHSTSEAILFLDDDTELDPNVIRELSAFLEKNPRAMGVQPQIRESFAEGHSATTLLVWNAFRRIFMLAYWEPNKLGVRRSGTSILPATLTKVISAERLSGCACYRRYVFSSLNFDINLVRSSFSEDLDFSFRVNRKYPNSLYAIPSASILHKMSPEARLQQQLQVYTRTVYWFYVFFKDVFGGSLVNLVAFAWAQIGNVLLATAKFLIQGGHLQRQYLLDLLLAYYLATRHLSCILRRDLSFVNRAIQSQ
jgi:GT2 family glycosyltransferase